MEGAEKGRAASLVLNKGHGHEGTSQTSQSLCWQELCQAQQRQEVGTCQALQGMWLGGGLQAQEKRLYMDSVTVRPQQQMAKKLSQGS